METNKNPPEVWDLFQKILGSMVPQTGEIESSGESIDNFLEKVPSILEKFRSGILPESGDSEEIRSKKEGFMFWLIYKILIIWRKLEICEANCSTIQLMILRMVQLRHPPLYKELVHHYILLLTALDGVADAIDNAETEVVFDIQFGPDLHSDFTCKDQKLAFKDYLETESFQTKIMRMLALSAEGIVQHLPDHLSKIWTVCCRKVQLGFYEAKIQALKTATKLMSAGGFPISMKVSTYFYDVLFGSLAEVFAEKNQNSTRLFQDVIGDCLNQLLVLAKSFFIDLKPLLSRSCLVWECISDDLEAWPEFTNHLRKSLKTCLILCLERNFTSTLPIEKLFDYFLQVPEGDGFDILPVIIYSEIKNRLPTKNATSTLKETRRKRKADSDNTINSTVIDLRTEGMYWPRLEASLLAIPRSKGITIELLTELRNLSRTYKGLFLLIKKRRGLSLDGLLSSGDQTEVIQYLIESIFVHASKPSGGEAFRLAIEAIESLLPLSSLDSTLMLSQITGLLTIPWMSGEVKLGDLKLNDTITYNMIQSAERISFPDEILTKCIKLVCSLPKEAAPKWRLTVFRKAVESQKTDVFITLLKHCPLLLHKTGPPAHPLVNELISTILMKGRQDLMLQLAKSAPLIICSQSKSTILEITEEGEFSLTCPTCSNNEKLVSSNTLSTDFRDTMMKLVGFNDNKTKLATVSMIKPLSNHVGMERATVQLWLTYAEDTDFNLVQTFAKKMKYLLAPSWWIDKEGSKEPYVHQEFGGWADQFEICEAVVVYLREACNKAIQNKDNTFVEVLCQMLVEIGSTELSSIEEHVLELLLNLLLNPDCHISAFCHAEDLLRNLIGKHKQFAMKHLAERMCAGDPKDPLNYVVVLYKNYTLKRFITQQLHYLLPHLVILVASKQPDPSPIDVLANILDVRTRVLLADNFVYIFPYMVMYTASTKDYAACAKFYEKEMKITMKQLVPSTRQKVLTELLLHFNHHQKRVVTAFQWLAQHDDEYTTNGKATKSDIALYILPKLLGVLGYFDQRLTNEFIRKKEKLQILESLHDIVEFMGSKHITTIKHKIIGTLNTAANVSDPEITSALCKLWKKFLKTVERNSIGAVLPQICASLLGIIDRSSEEVLEMLRFLIIENKTALRSSFNVLNFLPDLPSLNEINETIREVNGINDRMEFKNVLKLVLNSLENDTTEVKVLTLRKLKQLLHQNQGKLQGLILSSDQVDPFITSMVLSLMHGTRDSDPSVCDLIAQCLGEIGAIDPGRLHLIQDFQTNFDLLSMTIKSEDFTHDLLSVLVKAYSSSSESSETIAFSIQETLKAYNIKGPGDMNSPAGRIWNRCSESMQEIMLPFVTSLYTRMNKDITFPIPVYRSANGTTFQEWLSNWSCHLISKVADPAAKELFDSCKPTLRKDLPTAQFLLPYIIVYVLLNGRPGDHEHILKEINNILEFHGDVTVSPTSSSKMSTPASSLGSFPSRSVGTSLEEEQTPKKSPEGKSTRQLDRMASQTVFSILDHLNKWLRKKNNKIFERMRRSDDPEELKAKDPEFVVISKFVQSISQTRLAQKSFKCQSFARSLLHLETHLRDNPDELKEDLFTLQRVYGALEEPDYVTGVAEIRKAEPTLNELIFQHEATGRIHDALACYESLGQNREDNIETKSGMLRCYLEIGQPITVQLLSKGLVEKHPDWSDSLKQFQMEAAWQLCQWDEVDKLADKETSAHAGWEHQLGKTLISAYHREKSNLYKNLEMSQRDQILPLSAAAMEQGGYQRGYQHVVKLQIMNEIEKLSEDIVIASDRELGHRAEDVEELFSTWKTRMSYGQPNGLEPVLKVRRAILEMALDRVQLNPAYELLKQRLMFELGDCWLLSSKVARKTCQFQKAYSLLLEAKKYKNAEVFLEEAKLQWARDAKTEAIAALKAGIANCFEAKGKSLSVGATGDASAWSSVLKPIEIREKEVLAKAKLLLARYIDDAANMEAEMVPTLYKEAINVAGTSEDAYYFNGRFYDKLLGKLYRESDLDTRGEIICHVALLYGRSLTLGCDHLDQSLPRLLSLWFDYGARVVVSENKNKADMPKFMGKMNEVMSRLLDKLPPYYLLTTFPQLTSRICHSNPDVWTLLRNIIVKVFCNYPQHVFWQMVALSKSSYPMRSQRCREIFETIRANKPALAKFLDDAIQLSDKFLKLCDEKMDDGQASLRQVMPSLVRLMASSGFSEVLMPMTKNMTIMLPSQEVNKLDHNPFPGGGVYFYKPEDQIQVMKSLVRPKKVTFIGSDGHKYSFLYKPKDDLRRDCRLIDFNNLLNKLFMKDPESRKRDLHIRTYTVIPLNETNGIIEWVNNLQPLRMILLRLLREKYGVTVRNMGQYQTSKTDAAKNRRNYEFLLSKHPPVFGEWFVRNFPDPQTWFMARLSYTRTTAVMSMVGYLLGLGDRHGENIMFDSSNGDTVHVDLNCLFNKGDGMEIPELVPFRLTHNMVHAMGPTGVEGPFRIACETSLGLMRREKDVLMSALRPFYFDPLVEWVAPSNSRRKTTAEDEGGNEMAVKNLKNIENRLDGLVEKKRKGSTKATMINMPLSVAGQVDYLIREATSHDNLSQMYLGWAPYL